ncbi:E1-E2 ATPase family protein (macronuclear) [Tetrahymena thermophila SB210]|uniref:E1-E2 ATPase family protein n=1 Tax=Tetrahymena thermophila (strain SB210) TaxID=312017 RepID=Q23CL3_TETTS|nr:E1-E2 ATPase family protein [Tetrahymena thermophila SB210]EAR94267.2 E1-E2 ATPase family protein [Tetrahymena thermophila SB210]|eukprot:XP_001014512.2 E1-E2 ATPase family protein [Tetrahymena thermophila SB210]
MTEGAEKQKQLPILKQDQQINYQDIFEIGVTQINNYTVHSLPLEVLISRLQTDLNNGISNYRAMRLLELAGKNEIQISEKQSKIKVLIKEMFSRYQIPCWICCVALFCVYKVKLEALFILYLGLFNLLTILMGSIFILVQKQFLESLKSMITQQSNEKFKVVREGKVLRVCGSDLVEGDIIFINEGQIIPADIRVVEYDSIESDQSCLTGEGSPVKKNNQQNLQQNYIESSNILFKYCICSSGCAKGVVVKTGLRTMLGSFANYFIQEEDEDLSYNMNFIKKLKIYILFAFIISILFFQFSYQYKSMDIYECFSIMICVFLTNYPINLFLVAFSYQFQIVKSLYRQNILVKQIYHQFRSVRRNVQILLDIKTLSNHALQVNHIWYAGRSYLKDYDVTDLNFQALLKGLLVTCNATFDIDEYSKFNKINYDQCLIQGSISGLEVGQLKFLQNICDVALHQKLFRIVQNKDGSIAKNRNRIFARGQIVVVEEETNDSFYTAYIKGNVEDIIAYCSYLFVNGNKVKLDFYQMQRIHSQQKQYCKTDSSVIGVAMLPLSKIFFPRGSNIQLDSYDLPFALKDFIFCGMISQKEEIAQGISQDIEKLKQQNIKLAVLTNTQINGQIKDLLIKSGLISGGVLNNLELQENGLSLENSIQESEVLVIDNKEVIDYLVNNIKKLKEIIQSKKLLIFSQISYETKNILENIGAFNIYVSRQQMIQYYSNLSVIYGNTQDQYVKSRYDIILNDSNLNQVIKLIQMLKKHSNSIESFKKCYFVSTAIKILCFMLIAVFDIPILQSCFIMYLVFFLFDYLLIMRQKYTKITIND